MSETKEFKADLHIHSNFSDGLLTPEQVVKLAAKSELSAIALTDHDTIDGCLETEELAKDSGIGFINGCEFSTYLDGKEYHIIGYELDYNSKILKNHLSEFKDERLKRASKISDKLKKLGIMVSIDSILERAGSAPVGRPHIAAVMHEMGYISSTREAFSKYIGDNGPAYEAKLNFPVQKCINLIRNSGGVATLAHPGDYVKSSLIYKFVTFGLDGIEVYHPSHNPDTEKRLRILSGQYGLLSTGGSDFHGYKDYDTDNIGNFYVDERVFESIKLLSSNRKKSSIF